MGARRHFPTRAPQNSIIMMPMPMPMPSPASARAGSRDLDPTASCQLRLFLSIPLGSLVFLLDLRHSAKALMHRRALARISTYNWFFA